MAESSGLYLLHFDGPYRHARHYLGYSDNIARRCWEHFTGNGHVSPLVAAARASGSRLTVPRIWLGGDRALERRLKRQGGLSRHCPTCRASGNYHR